jgi:hypothetical protein
MDEINKISKLRQDSTPTTESTHGVDGVFSITNSFDTCLPLCSLLVERSPYSNLVVSPRVNVRQVDPSQYGQSIDGNSSISTAIFTDSKTFSARKLVLFPYTVKPLPNGADFNEDVSLVSISRGLYKIGDKIFKNTSVVVPNLQVTNVNPSDIECLAALLNYPQQSNTNSINFEGLLKKQLELKKSTHLLKFIRQRDLPNEIVDMKLRYEVNMTSLSSFLRMCTNIRLAQPEGQHRMECASRVLYGYKLLGAAPLRDDTETVEEVYREAPLQSALRSIPTDSTVFGNIPCQLYYQTPSQLNSNKLNVGHIKALQAISSTIQKQSKLEVPTSFQAFYMDLNRDINKAIKQDNLSFLTEKDWANLALKNISEDTDQQKKILALNRIISRKTVHRIYDSMPFNEQLPKQGGKTMTISDFFEYANTNTKWPTACLKPSLYQVTLFGKVKGNLKLLPPTYFGIRALWAAIKNGKDPVLNGAGWEILEVQILFDMFFALKVEKVASETFSKFLTFATYSTRFYHPTWLATYVFAPVNTIAHALVCNLSVPLNLDTATGKAGGANASSKHKLFVIIKRLLLTEYFNTIINHAGKKKEISSAYLDAIKEKHAAESLSLQKPTEDAKIRVKCSAFTDMVLLTLPELIILECSENIGESIAGPINMDFTAKTSGRYNEMLIPTIDNFLPKHLKPSTILSDELLRSNYVTPHLIANLEFMENTKTKTTPKKNSKKSSGSAKKATSIQQEEEPSDPPVVPQPAELPIDYSAIRELLENATETCKVMQKEMRANYATKLKAAAVLMKEQIEEITEQFTKKRKPDDQDPTDE